MQEQQKVRQEQEDNTAERIEELEGQFRSLCEQLTSELEDHSIQANELVSTVISLPLRLRNEYEDSIVSKLPALRTETTINGVMVQLSPLMNFIDYGLFAHLIGVFGSDRLKIDMHSYKSKILIFMKETTIAQLIDWLPGQEGYSPLFIPFMAKLDGDPRFYTLEELDTIRRRYCSALRLSEIVFHVITKV